MSRMPMTQWQGGFGLPALLLAAALVFGACATDDVEGTTSTEGPAPTTPTTVAASTTHGTSQAPSTDATTTEGTMTGGTTEVMPRFITQGTEPGAYAMQLGSTATLQLPTDATIVAVDGDAVLVIDVASPDATDARQWELRAVASGETSITAAFGGTERTWVLVVAG